MTSLSFVYRKTERFSYEKIFNLVKYQNFKSRFRKVCRKHRLLDGDRKCPYCLTNYWFEIGMVWNLKGSTDSTVIKYPGKIIETNLLFCRSETNLPIKLFLKVIISTGQASPPRVSSNYDVVGSYLVLTKDVKIESQT